MLNVPILRQSAGRPCQRGLSLVEMMVGIAVGLIVVAGASMLVSTQLGENRRLLIETQLQQDMRASMDIVTRELRRIGAQSDELAQKGIWTAGSAANKNDYAEVDLVNVNNLKFGYQQPGVSFQAFGFKLEGNVVKSVLGGDQELTDANVLKVTTFDIVPRSSTLLRLPCPTVCADGTTDCWPQVQVREFEIKMEAESRAFPDVKRTISSNVRLRNDYVRFNTGSASNICPAA